MQKVLIYDLFYPYAHAAHMMHITEYQLVTKSNVVFVARSKDGKREKCTQSVNNSYMANTVSFSNFAGKTILKNS